MTLTDSPESLFAIIQSGWMQITAIVGIIWWSRKIDLRTQDHSSRLDRHEARLTASDHTQQQQAIQLARIEEAMSGIKLTLDRVYEILRDRP